MTLVHALRKRLGFPKKHHDHLEDHLVWDVPNPFADPDPSQARLRALIEDEIARMRRYESIGPLDRVHDDDEDDSDDYDSDEYDSDEYDSEEDDYDGDCDSEDDHKSESDEDRPTPIALPRLLPIPLRFISPMDTPAPAPPIPSNDEAPVPWADIAEAQERAARKAKRDAHRSHSKALAILGPEASSAL